MDLSVLIPARNEAWLKNTIDDILEHREMQTEVIVVLDGQWPVEAIPDHPDVHLVFHAESVGQRAAVNEAARMSTGRYVMKLDAHCAVSQGFDRVLVETGDELGLTATQILRMYNLHVFDWECRQCHDRTYQGPTPVTCKKCQSTEFDRQLVWKMRRHKRTDFARFDTTLHFQYFGGYEEREAAQGDICDVMTSIGAMFCMPRRRFLELGGLDETHGSWGQFGVEIALKSALSGGRHVVNKRGWFAHCFRTQGGDFGFPYPMSGNAVERAREYSRKLWVENTWPGQRYPLAWWIEQFAPVPDWHEPAGAEALQRVRNEAKLFDARQQSRSVPPADGIWPVIELARYGVEGAHADVTPVIQRLVRLGHRTLTVKTEALELAHDPARGQRKTLTVAYALPDRRGEAAARERETLFLPTWPVSA